MISAESSTSVIKTQFFLSATSAGSSYSSLSSAPICAVGSLSLRRRCRLEKKPSEKFTLRSSWQLSSLSASSGGLLQLDDGCSNESVGILGVTEVSRNYETEFIT